MGKVIFHDSSPKGFILTRIKKDKCALNGVVNLIQIYYITNNRRLINAHFHG